MNYLMRHAASSAMSAPVGASERSLMSWDVIGGTARFLISDDPYHMQSSLLDLEKAGLSQAACSIHIAQGSTAAHAVVY